jgi:hypothetical protein
MAETGVQPHQTWGYAGLKKLKAPLQKRTLCAFEKV